jgi:hypothetical protein
MKAPYLVVYPDYVREREPRGFVNCSTRAGYGSKRERFEGAGTLGVAAGGVADGRELALEEPTRSSVISSGGAVEPVAAGPSPDGADDAGAPRRRHHPLED